MDLKEHRNFGKIHQILTGTPSWSQAIKKVKILKLPRLNQRGQGFMEVIITAFISLIFLAAFIPPINTLAGQVISSVNNATNMNAQYNVIVIVLIQMTVLIIGAYFILGIIQAFYKPPSQSMGFGGGY